MASNLPISPFDTCELAAVSILFPHTVPPDEIVSFRCKNRTIPDDNHGALMNRFKTLMITAGVCLAAATAACAGEADLAIPDLSEHGKFPFHMGLSISG